MRVTGRAVAGGMELWRGAHDGGRVGRGMAPGRGGLLQGVGGGGERVSVVMSRLAVGVWGGVRE